MDTRKDDLPPTAYAVLALLHHGGELSGYEVRQWALTSLRHFYWSPAQSQIYRELRRLADAGYVTTRAVAQQGRPDKTVHAMTDAGRAALAAWVRRPEVEAPQFKHPMALRLFAGDLGSADTTRHALETHIAGTERQLGELEELAVALADDERARFAHAVAEWGIEILSADRSASLALVARLDELYAEDG